MAEPENVHGIPVVDFRPMSIEHEVRPDTNSESVQLLAKQVYDAFSTVGFVYLKNHGISQQQIDGIFDITNAFFTLSPEAKQKCQRSRELVTSPNGWEALGRISTNPNRPTNLCEAYEAGEIEDEGAVPWPDEDLPKFKPTVKTLYRQMAKVGMRMLTVMAMGLGLDPDVFKYAFKRVGKPGGRANLRLNYYPGIKEGIEVKPNQLRCGEHTDLGGITLLLQDEIGGLQVRNLDGEFVDATPIKGTILINIADLMQQWTADKLKSIKHRVLLPTDESKLRQPRRSVGFFLHPDHEALITCLDGSNKYPPVRAGEHICKMLSTMYRY